MSKKYDLIVVGAGPAGLMAAKTAAEDGLKVILIERKRNITEINRVCAQFTSINFSVTGFWGPVKKYGYLEPISLEVGTNATKVHFPGPEFSIDYDGPLRPYLNMIDFSPSGYRIYREKAGTFFGFFLEKESLLASLLSKADKAGLEVLTATVALGAENTTDGVKVRVRTESGEQTLEGRKVIAADGIRSNPNGSSIVESLGLNKKRQVLSSRRKGVGIVGYVLEGVETEYRLNSWLNFTIPDLGGLGDVMMFMLADDRNGLLIVGGSEVLDKFMMLPFYEPWFRHARVVKKIATALGVNYTPIMEPVDGNVLIIGDAAAFIETTNPGALACGYQGAKATLKELNGEKGYPEYIKWWQEVIETNHPEHPKAAARYHALSRVCSNEEIDYIYHLLRDQTGMRAILVAKNLERIKGERPELYTKLKNAGFDEKVDEMNVDLFQVIRRPE